MEIIFGFYSNRKIEKTENGERKINFFHFPEYPENKIFEWQRKKNSFRKYFFLMQLFFDHVVTLIDEII